MRKIIFALLSLSFLASCTFAPKEENQSDFNPNGDWLGELALNDSTTLNFNFTVANAEGRMRTILHNGEEDIFLTTEYFESDSVVLTFPVYQSRIVANTGDGIWTGYFEKLDVDGEYRIPFVASHGISDRLPNNQDACCKLAPRYKTTFAAGEKTTAAVGEFQQYGNKINGSFLTPYGDYRFLEGKLNGDDFTIFGFDGGYLQVFKAQLKNDTLHGHYYSGLTGYKTFVAAPNDTFQLVDPKKMSQLNPEMDSISFAYPDLNGGTLQYNPAKFAGKVVVLQITGSWCPNCKDQAKFLQQLKNEFPAEKLEVMGIAFERMGTLEKSVAAAKKSKEDLEVDYPVGVAKYSRDQKADEVFPFLTKIRSYPTLLIIDKMGKVREIHTGFAGPGTSRYEEETAGLTQLVKSLMDE